MAARVRVRNVLTGAEKDVVESALPTLSGRWEVVDEEQLSPRPPEKKRRQPADNDEAEPVPVKQRRSTGDTDDAGVEKRQRRRSAKKAEPTKRPASQAGASTHPAVEPGNSQEG